MKRPFYPLGPPAIFFCTLICFIRPLFSSDHCCCSPASLLPVSLVRMSLLPSRRPVHAAVRAGPRLALVEGEPATLRLVGRGSSHQRRRHQAAAAGWAGPPPTVAWAAPILAAAMVGRRVWTAPSGSPAPTATASPHQAARLGLGFHMIRRRPSAPKSKRGREKAKIRHFGCS